MFQHSDRVREDDMIVVDGSTTRGPTGAARTPLVRSGQPL